MAMATAARPCSAAGSGLVGGLSEERPGPGFGQLHRRLLEEHEAEVASLRSEVADLRRALGEATLAKAGDSDERAAGKPAGLAPPRGLRRLQASPSHAAAPANATAVAVAPVAAATEEEEPPWDAGLSPVIVGARSSQNSGGLGLDGGLGRLGFVSPPRSRRKSLPMATLGSTMKRSTSNISSLSADTLYNHQVRLLRETTSRQVLSEQSADIEPFARGRRARSRHLMQEGFFAILIAANAIMAGVETARKAQGRPLSTKLVSALDIVTCLAWTAELAARARRETLRKFCIGRHQAINMFDLVLVLGLIAELVLTAFDVGDDAAIMRQLSSLRLFRLCQLLRFVDMSRKSPLFREVRVFAISFRKSLAAISWIAVLISTFMYAIAVSLLSVATSHCIRTDGADEIARELPICKHFGSLSSSMLTLYKATFGGMLWGDVIDALEISGVGSQLFFFLFMITMLLIVVNIVIGIILGITDRARSAQKDHRISNEMRDRQENILALRDIFWEMDINNSGELTKDELDLACKDLRIDALLTSLGIKIFDIERIFDLIDSNRFGVVSIEEFIMACQRLQGEARAVDMMLLQQQMSKVLTLVKDINYGMGAGPSLPGGISHRGEDEDDDDSDDGRDGHMGSMSTGMVRSDTSGTIDRKSGLFCSESFTVIPQPEMRAMTLGELRELRSHIERMCPDGWVSKRTGASLTPSQVDMYAVVYNLVGPYTVPKGVVLKGVKTGVYEEGQLVEQAGTKAVGVVKLRSEGKDVEVDVIRGCFRTKDDGVLTIDKEDCGCPQDVEVPISLSYKELLGSGPCKPQWYCTHWWGEPVLEFIACVQEQAKCRMLGDDAGYWICGYALRQHNAGCEMGLGDVVESPFYRALRIAAGILLVVDPQAKVFSRIWCDFELFVNLTSNNDLLDIVTVQEKGDKKKARLFSGSLLPYETLSDQRKRERRFPMEIFMSAMRVELQSGSVSREEDKQKILKFLWGYGENSQLDKANRRLRSLFAKAAWPEALRCGIVDDFDVCNPGSISLPKVLSMDVQRTHLSLSFACMEEANTAAVRSLAKGLPKSLVQLQLSFEGCLNVTDKAVTELANGLPQGLHELHLDFLGCKAVTDTGLMDLARKLPRSLTSLSLHFDNCSRISPLGLRALVEHLPKSVQAFTGTFHGTAINDSFASASDLRKVGGRSRKSLLGKMPL